MARRRAFFQTGATRPVAVRVAALHKLKREMQARETILLDALYADLHKSHAEGYMCELGLNLDELGYLARKLPQWAKPQRHPHPLAQFYSSSYQLAEAPGGAGDVPLELPLPAEPGPPFRGHRRRQLRGAQAQRLRPQHQPGHGGAHRRRLSPGLGHCIQGGGSRTPPCWSRSLTTSSSPAL